MVHIYLRYYLLVGKWCTLALPIYESSRGNQYAKSHGKIKNCSVSMPRCISHYIFFAITQYNLDTHNARTLTPMNVRT
jgi:hypothetical protein